MESVAVDAATLGGGQLNGNLRVVQVDAVVARAHRLVAVAEHGCVLLSRGDGQQGDVAKVADARSAEVGMAKAQQHVVAVVIARAPVPAARMLGGPQLNEAKRHVGTEKHVAVATRADAQID